MKKTISILLVAVLVITSAVTLSSCNTVNDESDFEIYEMAGIVGITKYVGSSKNVVIPEKIKGFEIDMIDNAAFENQPIESVAIPNCINSINDRAFAGCTELKEVNLGDVVEIRDEAFKACTALEEIEIPQQLTSIYDRAFEGCTSLKSISIPSQTAIGEAAFLGCTALKKVEYEAGRDTIVGCLAFYELDGLEEIIIPAGVTKIVDTVCNKCPNVKITFLGDAPEVKRPCFGKDMKDLKIYYKKGTKGWDTTDLAKWYTLVEY